jgi:hypothetical protein
MHDAADIRLPGGLEHVERTFNVGPNVGCRCHVGVRYCDKRRQVEHDLLPLHCQANAISVGDVSGHNFHIPLKSGSIEPASRAQRVVVHEGANLRSELH